VRLGRGPATVIGSPKIERAINQDTRRAADACALREKERGPSPSFSWGFFVFRKRNSERSMTREKTIRGRFCCGAIVIAALCGLAQIAGAQQTPPPQNSEKQTAEAAQQMVTDDTGRQVTLPQTVRRIVSLAPSATEIIFALGAGDRLVGDTDYCDYPAEAKTKPKVGGVMNPNFEQVVALKPDVVVAAKAGNRKDTVDALERLHLPVYGLDARTVDDVLQSVQHLGEVIGAREQGKALVATLTARLDDLKQKLTGVQPVRVLFVVWREPLISIGQQTFIADALRRAGAESVIDVQQDWPHVNLEEVVHLQPEYLVIASDEPTEAETDLAWMRSTPGWRDLKAVQEKKLAVMSEAVDRPVPRLVDAIEQLARELHPEAFAAPPAQVQKTIIRSRGEDQ
jgi:iron complex transport system substrate-binding protein